MTAIDTGTVTLKVDGREVSVSRDSTILDAAKKLGIEIPTLCHSQSLQPYGSCWVCVVKLGNGKMVPSCSTKVMPDMEVITNDDEVRQTRKLCIELLLSDHHGDCLGPCQMTCPAGIDVQGYIALAARGEYEEALKLIKQRNPLPLICGRVCPRPCEDQCRRNLVDEPVSVDAIKRFVADRDRESGSHYVPPVAQPTGKKVAVIGGGPAGLTASYYLAQRGHKVAIFEAQPKLGGMLIWGIPAYRLPREVLADEINTILELGVDVKYNTRLGSDITLEDIKAQGFDAAFLGLGAVQSRGMRVEGENLENVMSGTDFLRDLGLGSKFDFTGKKVAVIGGGNTAIDAARTSLRLGADEVTVIYRRGRAEMPAQDIEVEDAEKEGVKFHFLAAPTKIIGDGKVEKLEFVRMELGEPDASGRRRPVPVEGSETELDLDYVIAAIGQVPEISCLDETEVEKTSWGSIAANERSLQTRMPWVFAGGDCVHGAATVVEAVAHGREAAISIDSFLNGREVERTADIFNIKKGEWKEMDPADFEHFLKTPRQHMSCLDAAARIGGFDEVELGLTEKQVKEEASRCLECGCNSTFECTVRKIALEYDAAPERFEGDYRKEDPDTAHPLVRLEMQKCIMCGACVRACDEVHDVRAIGFTGRGFDARVRPAFGGTLLQAGCISCGACVDICPTGAISENLPKGSGPFRLEGRESVCSGCGVGCVMEVDIAPDGRVMTVGPLGGREPRGVNEGAFCTRGRFGYRTVDENTQIKKPLLNKSESSIEDAVAEAKSILSSAKNPVILVSPHAPLEEILAASSLASRTGAKLGSLTLGREAVARGALGVVLDSVESPRKVEDIIASDFILVAGCDPLESHHVAGVRALAASRMGAGLAVLAEDSGNKMLPSASVKMRAKAGSGAAVLAYVAQKVFLKQSGACSAETASAIAGSVSGLDAAKLEAVSDVAQGEVDELAEKIMAAKNPLIIISTATTSEFASAAAALSAALASDADKLPLLALGLSANSCGALRTGVAPVTKDELAEADAVLCIREEAAAFGITPEKLVVMDAVSSDSSVSANVVLPLPSLYEARGTYIASGGACTTTLGLNRLAGGTAARESLANLCDALGAEQVNPDSICGMTADYKPKSVGLVCEAVEGTVTTMATADTFSRSFMKWVKESGIR